MAAVTNRERVHTYLLVKGAGPAERVIVWDTQDVSVGRSPENDLTVDDAALSRKHAEFYRAEGGYAVKDLATSNGTTVNNETIRTRVLQNKDVVRLGEVEIQFLQIAKNPAAVGKRVEFASQLKSFGGAAGQVKDGESTMLGLVAPLEAESDEEDFVIGKVNDFGDDLGAGAKEAPRRPAPRDLDLELGGLGDDLMEPPAKAAPTPAPARAPAPKPAQRVAPPAAAEWSLDDVPEARPAAKPAARPVARPAAPAPAAPAPAAKPARRSVSLQLEIDGLTGDLHQLVESLLGKVIELPPLRIRVKSDDLG